MKVLLIKDVYKLGRAGEIKKVAAGYGRNYLIPQGFAIPATSGSIQQAERIKVKATELRAALNEELSDIAEVLSGKTLIFAVKAGETGHLYGSVSSEDIVAEIKAKYDIDLEKRQVETEPLRQLGTYTVPIQLTMDLVPEITVIVHREGEALGEEEVEPEAEALSLELESPLESEVVGEDSIADEALEYDSEPEE
jgi:large subunit ribosomal protein L9